MYLVASVICVYNDSRAVNSQLCRSLENQTDDFELILINNTNRKYKSAAEALDYGVRKSSSEVLVFIHQDVYIKEADGLHQFVSCINAGEEGDIFGVAGSKETEKRNIGMYTSGDVYIDTLNDCEWSIKSVSCLDECMFGMKRSTYYSHPFDTAICDDWHLYCVEMCLNARKNGANVWVIPIQVHHFSNGTITPQYMTCLKKLVYKYNKSFKYVWTTAYKVRCNKIYISALVFIWRSNRFFREILKK